MFLWGRVSVPSNIDVGVSNNVIKSTLIRTIIVANSYSFAADSEL